MRLCCAFVIFLIGQVCSETRAQAGDTLAYGLAGKPALGALTVGEFAAGTLDHGMIETQTPKAKLPVSDVSLTIAAGGETGCGGGLDVAAALGKANSQSKDEVTDECLMLATVSVAGTLGVSKIEGECDDWRNDISYCWIEGDAGQFWLRRKAGNDKALQLIVGPLKEAAQAEAAAVPAPDKAAPPVQTRGVMLESTLDDSGLVVTDHWLLFPPEVVTLDLER